MRKILVILLVPLLIMVACSSSDTYQLKVAGIISITLYRGSKSEPVAILEEDQFADFILAFKELKYTKYNEQMATTGADMIKIVYEDCTYEIDYLRTVVTKKGEALGTGFRYLYDEEQFRNFINQYIK